MDKLEKFIIENREGLDRYEPDPSVWETIRSRDQTKQRYLLKILFRAAMITLILSSSLIIYMALGGGKSVLMNSPLQSQQQTIPELRETEIYYTNRLNTLLKQAKPLLTSYPMLEEELYSDLSRLDSLCLEIKHDLRDNISNQEVIEALILNFRIKVQILEDMLVILKQEENINSDNHSENEIL